ncbi:MAG: hypothetical protein HC902_08210 [Calothrix sp. SM1_5_4]|nr:hypothetical protein [Calothrix sp. SM1_5_4]
MQFLRGEISHEGLVPRIVEKTMQLAKKQRTWFKRDGEVRWVSGVEEASGVVRGFLDRLGRKS